MVTTASRQYQNYRFNLVYGDITRHQADAIVNAANPALGGGGGVDGAIHRAAGPELVQASRPLGPIAPGEAVITDAFALKAYGVRHVIHAVGPIWDTVTPPVAAHTLSSAYTRALELAEGAGCASVAFASIGTGIYAYPLDRAAPLALVTIDRFFAAQRRGLQQVNMVCNDKATHNHYAAALDLPSAPKPQAPPRRGLGAWLAAWSRRIQAGLQDVWRRLRQALTRRAGAGASQV